MFHIYPFQLTFKNRDFKVETIKLDINLQYSRISFVHFVFQSTMIQMMPLHIVPFIRMERNVFIYVYIKDGPIHTITLYGIKALIFIIKCSENNLQKELSY